MSLKGTTAIVISAGTTEMKGAAEWRSLSAFCGTKSSFQISFIASAAECSRPKSVIRPFSGRRMSKMRQMPRCTTPARSTTPATQAGAGAVSAKRAARSSATPPTVAPTPTASTPAFSAPRNWSRNGGSGSAARVGPTRSCIFALCRRSAHSMIGTEPTIRPIVKRTLTGIERAKKGSMVLSGRRRGLRGGR